jgi:peptidoglycan/LPS O-acetylase OafA/YrhL
LKRIPSLDGIRAISIVTVVLGHLLASWRTRHNLNPTLAGMVQGYQGVFIFFVISGYLITTLLVREYDRRGTIRFGRFYYRRFFRIVPPLYAYILIAVLFIGPGIGIHAELREVLTSLTFTRNLDFHPHQLLFEHFWSLSIEEQFYLLWPLTLLAILRWKGRKGASQFALCLIILSPLYRLATFAFIPFQPFRIFINWLLPGHLDSLMFGCWAALAEGSPSFETLYKRITRYAWALPVWVFVISTSLIIRFGNFYYLSLGHTLDGIAVVFGILWAIRNTHSPAYRFLNWRPVVHLGVISYSLYIWQNCFVNDLNRTFSGHFPWNVLFALAAAECSWQTVERASLFLRDRWEPRLFPPDQNPTAVSGKLETVAES